LAEADRHLIFLLQFNRSQNYRNWSRWTKAVSSAWCMQPFRLKIRLII